MKNAQLTLVNITVIICLTAIFSGCEPSAGRVLEEKSKKVGGFEIALVRHAEGAWGNAAKGEHYRAYCRSDKTKGLVDGQLLISTWYMMPPQRLRRLPIDQLTIVNEKIAFGYLDSRNLFCTFDGCSANKIKRWDIEESPDEIQHHIYRGIDGQIDPFILKAEYEAPDGVRLHLNPKWFEDGRTMQVYTRDQCKSWETKTITNK